MHCPYMGQAVERGLERSTVDPMVPTPAVHTDETLTARGSRPTGVTAVAWLLIVIGAVGIVIALLSVVFGVQDIAGGQGESVGFGYLSTFGGSAIAIVAVVQIIVGWGLLALHRWAWLLAQTALALTFLTGVSNLSPFDMGEFLVGVIPLLVPAGLFMYLLTPPVRHIFRITRDTSPRWL